MSDSIGCLRSRLEHLFLDGALNCLQDFLTRHLVEAWASELGHRWRTCLFSPLPTLLACIYKQLAAGTSCRDVEDWVASRLPPTDSTNAGDDFCEARKRLPESLFARALAHLGALASDSALPKVWLVDGTGLTLPRSAANFEAFGKPHRNSSFPGARLLLLTDAQSGAFGERIRELPSFMRVRVVRVGIERKGYRPVNISIATNLLDAAQWPPSKIIELYALRWRIENDIRDLKLRHGLAMLSCKSEDTVRKEVWSALIACNAVRVMQSKTGQCPRSLSHERCRAILLEACSQMAQALTTCLPMLNKRLLKRIAQCKLKRQERPPCPRALIRNPRTDYPFLNRTRQAWYAHYLAA